MYVSTHLQHCTSVFTRIKAINVPNNFVVFNTEQKEHIHSLLCILKRNDLSPVYTVQKRVIPYVKIFLCYGKIYINVVFNGRFI